MLQIAERIIVMKNGRIVQDGRHEELVAVDGEYKRMYELQKKWYTYPELKVREGRV